MTSHAAVVARGMGRPCVSGSSEIDINYDQKIFKTSSVEVKEGETITIDGSTGRIILGTVPTVKPEISGDFSKLMSWADKIRKLKVRTNSETPLDTKTAVFVSNGVSEFVLTFNFLILSAQLINFEKSPEISGFTVGTVPKIILPVEPSMVIVSPSLTSTEEVLKIF